MVTIVLRSRRLYLWLRRGVQGWHGRIWQGEENVNERVPWKNLWSWPIPQCFSESHTVVLHIERFFHIYMFLKGKPVEMNKCSRHSCVFFSLAVCNSLNIEVETTGLQFYWTGGMKATEQENRGDWLAEVVNYGWKYRRQIAGGIYMRHEGKIWPNHKDVSVL
jgi:hypothetical protein